MDIKPSLSDFKKLARKGNLIPVYTDVMADQITPVALLSSQWASNSHCFLLESVEGGEKLGRYSIVSFEPEAILREEKGVSSFMTLDGKTFLSKAEPGLEALRRYMSCVKPVNLQELPRFYGGAVGFCSYEVVHGMEKLPKTNPDVLKWPDSLFFITGDLFVFDNTNQVLKLITCARLKNQSDATAAYARARRRILANVAKLRQVGKFSSHVTSRAGKNGDVPFESNVDRAAFIKAVKAAKEHISRGDIIQVVLSRRNERKTTASPLDIYRSLRVVNPSPYMYLFKIKDRAIIGSSPESLVRLEDGVATTRPIAGTRRRGATPELDNRLKSDLLRDPKEIAEHIMLVDLGRNDLGRVCESGTVKVPTFMTVEKYSHVMHIVSEVVGRLKAGKDAFDLLRAAFPAGTVAGAPKIRAMEIIDDLETSQRGPYAGAIGYISYSGNMDLAITIRTILWDKGRVSIQTGAGIVADSKPASEFQETENKAAGMKETIRLAESCRLFWEKS